MTIITIITEFSSIEYDGSNIVGLGAKKYHEVATTPPLPVTLAAYPTKGWYFFPLK